MNGPRAEHDQIDVHVIRMEVEKPYFDAWYLATIPGGLKIIHVAGGFVVLVCMLMVHAAVFMTYLCAIGVLAAFVVSVVLLIMYLFNLVQLVGFNLKRTEMFFCMFGFVMYFATGIFMTYSAVTWRRTSGMMFWAASAFFAYLVCAAYAADFGYRFKKLMSQEAAPTEVDPSWTAEAPLQQTTPTLHEQSFAFSQEGASDGYGHYGTPPSYTSATASPPLTYGQKVLA